MFSNKALKKMIIPLVIEQILVMMVGMVDTAMVSHVGEAAISGVSLVDMINNLIIFILAAIATGGAVIVSQYIGKGDKEETNLSACQLITISLLISVVLMVLCLVFHRPLLQLIFGSVEADVMEASITYFVICSISLPFLGIYNACSALYRSMGKTKVMMYLSFMINIINFAGDYIGVFVLNAGVAGVAVPTLITRTFSGIVMLYLAIHEHHEITIQMKKIFSWNKVMIAKILHVAIPNGIENGLFYLGKVLVTSIVAMFGTTQIAANGVANSIDQIVPIVVNALNLAVVTVVGQCVGAQEYEQAKYYIRRLMRIAYLSTGVLNLLVFVSLPLIFQLYTLSPEVEQLCYLLVILHNLLALLLHPTSFILPNAIRAAGDVKFTMYAGILSMIIFRLGSAVLFGLVLDMGVIGVWIAMGMDWLFRSVLFVWRYRKGTWMQYRII